MNAFKLADQINASFSVVSLNFLYWLFLRILLDEIVDGGLLTHWLDLVYFNRGWLLDGRQYVILQLVQVYSYQLLVRNKNLEDEHGVVGSTRLIHIPLLEIRDALVDEQSFDLQPEHLLTFDLSNVLLLAAR